MKVTDTSKIRPLGTERPSETSRARSAERAPGGDRVSTEDSARVSAAIAATSHSASVARSAKLENIEAAVRQGTYRPDPQRIAAEILDDAELAARLQALFGK